MSNKTTDTASATATSNKRIKYGFTLNFPEKFTLRELRKLNYHKIKYITIYSRVRKALDEGTLVEDSLKDPVKSRRGRKEVIYRVVKNSTASEAVVDVPLITADVAVPAVANW